MMEIGDLANFYSGDLSELKANGDVLNSDVKPADGYSRYSEMFSPQLQHATVCQHWCMKERNRTR